MLRRLGLLALAAAGVLLPGCADARRAPDFTLRDDRGGTWQLAAQRGKTLLLTFGYTHCGDSCPAIVARLERVTERLGARSRDVEVVLVTVDPARDTPGALHAFLDRFAAARGAKLVGLTGTPAQIAAVEDGYHVWAKALPPHGKAYDVAHSTFVYVIGPNQRIAAIRDDDDSDRTMLASLSASLE